MAEDRDDLLEDAFAAVPLSPAPPPAEAPSPGPGAPAEVIAPTPIMLREGGTRPGSPRRVLATLTTDALWLQDTWQLRHVPLTSLAGVAVLSNGEELNLTFPPETSAETLRLTFA